MSDQHPQRHLVQDGGRIVIQKLRYNTLLLRIILILGCVVKIIRKNSIFLKPIVV